MLSRSGDDRSTAKLLETFVGAAADPEEVTSTLWELAAYRSEVQGDLAGARDSLERALATDPAHAASWLSLEIVAAKAGDPASRARALDARARMATEPTMQGTLLTELALVIRLQAFLSGRKRWALRVVHEVQHQPGIRRPITQRVQPQQARNALFVD
jgi:Tfp pilus assembly protein PilF